MLCLGNLQTSSKYSLIPTKVNNEDSNYLMYYQIKVEDTLAIENIWIIDSLSGICIFDWYSRQKDKTIDEQLVSGLLIAFKNFSSEAGLVDISAIEGIDKKLAYKSDDRFIIAGICHLKDFEQLIDKTLLDLLEKFRKKYKKLIDDQMTTDVSPFRTFEDDIIERLEGTTSDRNFVTLSTGVITSLCVAALVFVIYFFTISPLQALASEGVGNLIGLIIIIIGMLLGGFFGGLVAGDRKLGMISGTISVLPVIVLMTVFFNGDWQGSGAFFYVLVFALMYLLLFGAMAILGGLLGGFVKESKYFLPSPESDDESEEDE